jgi:UDP-N-acetylmuramate--alanine ligase
MELDLNTIKHVHFIGIGGIGVSAIARMMMHDGKVVSGQDMQDSEIIHDLQKAGAEIKIGQSFENIPEDTDLIVYTIAIENYDPELFEKLKAQNITIRSYPQMLGIVSKGKYTIAITGTHGKTTTTGMITQIMRDAGKDPTVVIGSLLVGDKSNFIAGKSEYFIVEACEYKRSFLEINPKVLVITNIDADHLDYYKDIEDIKSAFRELAMRVPKDGFVVCDLNSANIKDVVEGIQAQVIDYKEFFDPNLKLKIPGVHNKMNASAARATCSVVPLKDEEILKGLANFPGTWRRFEYKGTLKTGTKVYDDYAHHPVEISACLQGFRELYPKTDGWKITIVFHPHLFSRTKALLPEFAKCFSDGDLVLVLPIYFAREVADGSISSFILADKIKENGVESQAFPDFKSAEEFVANLSLGEKDIFLTLGAGTAFEVGDYLLEQ